MLRRCPYGSNLLIQNVYLTNDWLDFESWIEDYLKLDCERNVYA